MDGVEVSLAIGRSIAFEVAGTGPGPHFLLGVRKSGSSILNNICRALAGFNQRHFVDVGHAFFGANVVVKDWIADPALRAIIRPGNIYGGFRDMPVGLSGDPGFDAAPKLLMVRDPRDALVSEYFSNAYSHIIPDKSEDSDAVAEQMLAKRREALSQHIEEFVLRMARAMNNTMLAYAPIAQQPNTLVVKYEDMIFDKRTLIAKLCERFALVVKPHEVDLILGWADQRPAAENPTAFVRKVAPGDHREKLTLATIAALNRALAPAMDAFNYTY